VAKLAPAPALSRSAGISPGYRGIDVYQSIKHVVGDCGVAEPLRSLYGKLTPSRASSQSLRRGLFHASSVSLRRVGGILQPGHDWIRPLAPNPSWWGVTTQAAHAVHSIAPMVTGSAATPGNALWEIRQTALPLTASPSAACLKNVKICTVPHLRDDQQTEKVVSPETEKPQSPRTLQPGLSHLQSRQHHNRTAPPRSEVPVRSNDREARPTSDGRGKSDGASRVGGWLLAKWSLAPGDLALLDGLAGPGRLELAVQLAFWHRMTTLMWRPW
jgi:hypothetical protein